MEQRLHVREPIGLSVRLVQEGHVVATVKTVDMSRDGLGIECPNVVLDKGQIVDVDFYKPGHPRGISCCVPALVVVHTGPKSIGLMSAYDLNLKMVSPEHGVKSDALDYYGVSYERSIAT